MATTLSSPAQLYAPELARRVGLIVATLRTAIGRGFYGKIPLYLLGAPLFNHLSRILARFTALMDRLAAGRVPQPRRGPHTGGAPHPENLLRGNPLPTAPGWLLRALGAEAYWAAGCGSQLEHELAQAASAEILARVPAAARILRPLRRLLGLGLYNPNLPRPRKVGRKGAAHSANATSRRPEPAPEPPYKCRLYPPRKTCSRGYAWYAVLHPPKNPA